MTETIERHKQSKSGEEDQQTREGEEERQPAQNSGTTKEEQQQPNEKNCKSTKKRKRHNQHDVGSGLEQSPNLWAERDYYRNVLIQEGEGKLARVLRKDMNNTTNVHGLHKGQFQLLLLHSVFSYCHTVFIEQYRVAFVNQISFKYVDPTLSKLLWGM